MSKKKTNAFEIFSRKYTPRIDGVLMEYFDKKIGATKGIRRELYCDLKEYCTREGKRIRPLIFLAGFMEYSQERGKTSEAVKIAAALELMHSFLLIQDDIIDRADMRRGKPALHVIAAKKYSRFSKNPSLGSDVAIVMADILFSLALEIIAGANFDGAVKDSFLRLFSETYERTAYGQMLDVLYSRPKSIPPADAAGEISSEKTAYYTVVYPLLMGYVLSGGGNKKEIEKIHDFALPIGMAFQVRDDVLGVYGKTDMTGKPSDSDIEEGKLTMLVQKRARTYGTYEI
jgi:geranylgeranyl diphosphate synthase type I